MLVLLLVLLGVLVLLIMTMCMLVSMFVLSLVSSADVGVVYDIGVGNGVSVVLYLCADLCVCVGFVDNGDVGDHAGVHIVGCGDDVVYGIGVCIIGGGACVRVFVCCVWRA